MPRTDLVAPRRSPAIAFDERQRALGLPLGPAQTDARRSRRWRGRCLSGGGVGRWGGSRGGVDCCGGGGDRGPTTRASRTSATARRTSSTRCRTRTVGRMAARCAAWPTACCPRGSHPPAGSPASTSIRGCPANFGALTPLRDAAHLLPNREWPRLYDHEVLRHNERTTAIRRGSDSCCDLLRGRVRRDRSLRQPRRSAASGPASPASRTTRACGSTASASSAGCWIWTVDASETTKRYIFLAIAELRRAARSQ